eukprot:scaffold15296_cov101-Isochrysis_galbana.AAC.2
MNRYMQMVKRSTESEHAIRKRFTGSHRLKTELQGTSAQAAHRGEGFRARPAGARHVKSLPLRNSRRSCSSTRDA